MPFPLYREVLAERQPLLRSHQFVFHPLDLPISGREGIFWKKTRVSAMLMESDLSSFPAWLCTFVPHPE